jgi:hypothetical protein
MAEANENGIEIEVAGNAGSKRATFPEVPQIPARIRGLNVRFAITRRYQG